MADDRLLADGVDRELDPVPGAARIDLDDALVAVQAFPWAPRSGAT